MGILDEERNTNEVIEEVSKKLELSDDYIDDESVKKVIAERPWKITGVNSDIRVQHLLWQRALNSIDADGQTISQIKITKVEK